ncbi:MULTISPECIES: phage portal protein [Pantoea]|uniref:Phage portal protein n=1 Tax=Candidatus Pantoea gossypiicola TaxID=2608008 RepID=A0AB34CZ85_9GAMM|nr:MULTISPECIES: phage portal protein [Pantoea]KAA6006800.1 phage portal protein [Pantoea sp. F_7]KAA6015615.1 phage portal protein [Pantoea sp. F_18]KAA6017848.1 phage portal protein [Pantoea sp. F_5]KAA6020141.1 phage portal protein [Pantoea sp. F_15]KAA6027970.1 phage portal protein [Pantoea sp. F_17]
MNERELSLIKALGEEFGLVLREMRNDFEERLQEHKGATEQCLRQLANDIQSLKDAPEPDFAPLVASALSAITPPEPPPLPDVAAMVGEAIAALPRPQDGTSVTIDDVRPMLEELVSIAVADIPAPRDGKDYDPDVLKQAVSEAVASLPAPRDGTSVTVDDVRPMLEELVSIAVADIPAPRDGKDYDPDVLKQAVSEAVASLPAPRDGTSVTVDDVRPMLEELVSIAVADIPAPRDGKDYDPDALKQAVSEAVASLPVPQDGRDALSLELLPGIDESKSYPRGTWATHNGGLWRAYEKTFGMRGWECVVDGVSDVDVSLNERRCFNVIVNRASGQYENKTFNVPVMLYRGVFKADTEYLPGDTVTWGGSLWHCDTKTQDKPGETGSTGWTLAAKRGRDGRDKT